MKELLIYQKMYDCLLENYPVINKFPKAEKFTLQTDIKHTMVHMMRLIIRANKSRTKKAYLYELDMELETLRALIRLAKDLRFLSLRRYELVSKQLNEIGRLLGGWIRSTSEGAG